MTNIAGRNYIMQSILFLFVSYILMVNTACGSIRGNPEESIDPSTITFSDYQDRNATLQYTLSPTNTSSTQIINPIFSPTIIPTSSLLNNDAWENHGPYGGDISTLTIDPIHPSIMYAGIGSKNGGLWKSIDSGINWKRSDDGILSKSILFYYGITTLVVDPKTPSTLYAGIDQSGIFKSIDSGENWKPIHNEISGTRVKAMAVDPVTSGTVYVGTLSGIRKTVNGGNTWESVLESENSISGFISSIAVDPLKTSTIYAGTTSIQGGEKSGVYKSVDGGNHWTFSDIGLDNTDIQAIVIDPVQPKILYVGTIQLCGCGGGISDDAGGVYRSIDGGSSWLRMINGLSNVIVLSLAISPIAPSTVFAGTSGGAFISTNRGEYWKEIRNNKLGASVLAFAVDPISPSNIMMGTSGGIFKSKDNGLTWNESNHGLSGTNILALAEDPKRPERLIASVRGKGLYESTDNGVEWNLLSRGLLPPGNITTIAIDWSNPDIVYAGADNIGIYKSIDRGVSWQDLESGFLDLGFVYAMIAYRSVETIVIDPVDPKTIYIGTDFGVYISKNGGDTWIGFGALEARALAIDPKRPKTMYAGNYRGLFKKTDNSQEWEELLVDPDINHITAIIIDPLHTNIIFVSDTDSVFKSSDGGRNWTVVLRGQYLYSIAMDPVSTNTVYVSTINGFLQSTNGGDDWVNIGLPGIDVFTLFISRTSPPILHTGTTGGVYSVRVNKN